MHYNIFMVVKASSRNGDIFTPAPVVRQMSALCEPLISDSTRKVFEPGCGTGNFLVEALTRRLRNGLTAGEILVAVSNLYGVDTNAEYLAIARERLKLMINDFLGSDNRELDYRFWPLVDLFLATNLVQGDLIKQRGEMVFVDWRRVNDYEFRAVPSTLADLIKAAEGENV